MFRKVISFIYEKIYFGDRVPLRTNRPQIKKLTKRPKTVFEPTIFWTWFGRFWPKCLTQMSFNLLGAQISFWTPKYFFDNSFFRHKIVFMTQFFVGKTNLLLTKIFQPNFFLAKIISFLHPEFLPAVKTSLWLLRIPKKPRF